MADTGVGATQEKSMVIDSHPGIVIVMITITLVTAKVLVTAQIMNISQVNETYSERNSEVVI